MLRRLKPIKASTLQLILIYIYTSTELRIVDYDFFFIILNSSVEQIL